jgi:site-specific DNA-methyltransferase (adenine-specific)
MSSRAISTGHVVKNAPAGRHFALDVLKWRSDPRKAADLKEQSKLTKEEWKEFTKSVWQIANTSHPGHPAVFPEEIPRRLIKLFSMVGDVICDPFCGIGTTGTVALKLGRHFVGTDSGKAYLKIAKASLEAAEEEVPGQVPHYALLHEDARNLHFLPENCIDLIVTSPPYWNKADYAHNSFNVGCLDKYNEFLRAMAEAFREFHRLLQDGKRLCIVTANVNQYSEHGLLTFPIASDFIKLLQAAGFHVVNEIIWSKDKTGGKWGSFGAQRPIFGSYPYPPHFYFKNVHEYIIIAKKSLTRKFKGPELSSLMGN